MQNNWESIIGKLNGAPVRRSVPKVLIVDDEEAIGNMLMDSLEVFQFDTAFAMNSVQAIMEMKKLKPDIALLDIRLDNEDGVELSQKLRAIDPHLPVILMTAYPSMELAQKLAETDIYDFLVKPVDKAYLLQSIWNAVKKRDLAVENKQLLLYLKAANATLASMNEMKSKFLTIVTHDLKTPLAAILGYVELLDLTDSQTPAKISEYVKTIRSSIDQMKHLIDNLMDRVGMESGKMNVEMMPTEYVQFCGGMKNTFTQLAAAKQITIEWVLPEKAVMIHADPTRLNQLLTNIISNAFKHTLADGRIIVKVIQNSESILTEVIDDGDGIPAEEQERIFQHHYQIEGSRSKSNGLGIGLYISQEIVNLHKGKIGVKSDGSGKGSTFWFTLPLLKTDTP